MLAGKESYRKKIIYNGIFLIEVRGSKKQQCSYMLLAGNKEPGLIPGLFLRAEDGTRTRYLQLGKLSLYQVSYFRLFPKDKISSEYLQR
jgi:hypothetical protein